MENHGKFWTPVAHFAGHAMIGCLIFVIIAAPAVALSHLVHVLDEHVDGFVGLVFMLLERIILIVDAVLFVVYLAVAGFKFIKDDDAMTTKTRLLSEFIDEFVGAMREGPRMYFAPLVGAYRAMRDEVCSTPSSPEFQSKVTLAVKKHRN